MDKKLLSQAMVKFFGGLLLVGLLLFLPASSAWSPMPAGTTATATGSAAGKKHSPAIRKRRT